MTIFCFSKNGTKALTKNDQVAYCNLDNGYPYNQNLH